jgi:hypothetical protein
LSAKEFLVDGMPMERGRVGVLLQQTEVGETRGRILTQDTVPATGKSAGFTDSECH